MSLVEIYLPQAVFVFSIQCVTKRSRLRVLLHFADNTYNFGVFVSKRSQGASRRALNKLRFPRQSVRSMRCAEIISYKPNCRYRFTLANIWITSGLPTIRGLSRSGSNRFSSIALQPCERWRAATCGGSTRFPDRSPANREQNGGELMRRWHRRESQS